MTLTNVEGLSLQFSITGHAEEHADNTRWKRSVRCPRCSSTLRDLDARPSCSNTACEYSVAGFPLIDTQPVLIDFAASIFDRNMYSRDNGSVLHRDVTRRS